MCDMDTVERKDRYKWLQCDLPEKACNLSLIHGIAALHNLNPVNGSYFSSIKGR